MCHCSNPGMEWAPIKSQQHKVNSGEENFPLLLPGLKLATSRSWVRCSYQQAILAPHSDAHTAELSEKMSLSEHTSFVTERCVYCLKRTLCVLLLRSVGNMCSHLLRCAALVSENCINCPSTPTLAAVAFENCEWCVTLWAALAWVVCSTDVDFRCPCIPNSHEISSLTFYAKSLELFVTPVMVFTCFSAMYKIHALKKKKKKKRSKLSSFVV